MNGKSVNRIRKRLVIILILGFVFISSSIAFAFWDQTAVSIDENEILLGEGAILEISETVNPTQNLVPFGSFKGTNDIDEYTFSYIVRFNKEGRLHVRVDESSIRIGDGNHPFNDLVQVQVYVLETPQDFARNLEIISPFIQRDESGNYYQIEVFIRVFVLGPSDPSEYLSAYQTVARSKITFSVQFNALEIE